MIGKCPAPGAALVVAGAVVLLALAGCPAKQTAVPAGGPVEPPPDVASETVKEGSDVAWTLTSTAFANGERIPDKYTGNGEDVSPPLSWSPAPEGTAELALICDDPDAPAGTWNHWVLYGLSPEATGLEEGVATGASVADPQLKQGLNSWPKTGYGGPSPPPGGPHRYQFTLYALGEAVDLEPGATKEALLAAMEGKVIAEATLEGTYSR